MQETLKKLHNVVRASRRLSRVLSRVPGVSHARSRRLSHVLTTVTSARAPRPTVKKRNIANSKATPSPKAQPEEFKNSIIPNLFLPVPLPSPRVVA